MKKQELSINPIPQLEPLVRNKQRKIKTYNFKNPDKFSKDHLKILGNIHEVFCRQANMSLNATLRMSTDISVANVQQLTYSSYITSMPEDLLVGVLNMYPFTTQFSIGIEKHLMGAILDRLLGGAGMSNVKSELTDVELGIIKDTLRRMLVYLPEGWDSLIPATDDVELIGLEQNPLAVQIVPPTDIIALVTMNVEVGSYMGFMNICIPYAAVEDIIGRLNRQSVYRNDHNDDEKTRALVLHRLSNTTLPVKIVLSRGEMALTSIMALEEGDIVKLNTSSDDESEIWIGEELKYLGRPGQSNKKLSVAILKEYREDE